MSACSCDDDASSELTLCVIHHIYRKGDVVLPSVTQIIHTICKEAEFRRAPQWRIDNARERGSEVDLWLTRWLNGELNGVIPRGAMRRDSAALFKKLTDWWVVQDRLIDSTAQVRVHDDELAGTIDIVPPGGIWDLKTIYSLERSNQIQVGGYCYLFERQYGERPVECGVIHLTERFAEPQLVEFDVCIAIDAFKTVLEKWRASIESEDRPHT